jgi:hypothetical protein
MNQCAIQAKDIYNHPVTTSPLNQRVGEDDRKTEEAEEKFVENHDGS